MNTIPLHIPVMLDECLDVLAPVLDTAGAVFVDGTLGLGGHSEAVAERFPGTNIVGIDRDEIALGHARVRLAGHGDLFHGVHTTYDKLETALRTSGFSAAHGILLDLGISSMQIDDSERGFAYSVDAPLDMRMDRGTELTAEDILRDYSERELTVIFRDFGEEKLATRYAKAIVAAREIEAITRSGQLVDILNEATPYAVRNAGHPAKRVFQALRIEVNGELSILRTALQAALAALAVGGRLLVLSYHSLEDRIVKTAFTEATTSTAPHDLPVVPLDLRPEFRLVFRGSQPASETEITRNSRAASVRFRAIERIEARS